MEYRPEPLPFLLVPEAIRDAMIDHARRETPYECCGILGGKGIAVRSIHPLKNADPNPETRFESDPADLLQAARYMRVHGEDWLAIYHSHPETAAIPSQTDLKRNYHGATPCVIVTLTESEPEAMVRVWRLGTDQFWELPWRVIRDNESSTP